MIFPLLDYDEDVMPRPRFEKLDIKRQKEILQISKEEFSEHGYHKASFNRIMERLKVSKGAMYYYFDNKLDLFCTVMDEIANRFLEVLTSSKINYNNEDFFWSSLTKSFDGTTLIFQECSYTFGVYQSYLNVKESPDFKEHFSSIERKFDCWTEEVFKKALEKEIIRQDIPIALMVILFGKIIVSFDEWIAEISQTDKEFDLELSIKELNDLSISIMKRIFSP